MATLTKIHNNPNDSTVLPSILDSDHFLTYLSICLFLFCWWNWSRITHFWQKTSSREGSPSSQRSPTGSSFLQLQHIKHAWCHQNARQSESLWGGSGEQTDLAGLGTGEGIHETPCTEEHQSQDAETEIQVSALLRPNNTGHTAPPERRGHIVTHFNGNSQGPEFGMCCCCDLTFCASRVLGEFWHFRLEVNKLSVSKQLNLCFFQNSDHQVFQHFVSTTNCVERGHFLHIARHI